MKSPLLIVFLIVFFLVKLPAGSAGEGEKNHVFYLGSSWGSNLSYLGSSLSDDRGFLTTDFTYLYDSSLWASASLYNLPGHSSTIPFYDLSGGYTHYFNKVINLAFALSRHQVSAHVADSLFSSFTYTTLTLGADWNLLYTQISAGRILGDNAQNYLSIKNSRYMQTGKFWKDRSYFSFDPAVSLYFGNRTQIQSTTTRFPGTGFQGGGGRGPGGGSAIETASSSFGLMDLEFSLPVGFNYGIFSLEMEPVYIVPIYEDSNYPSVRGFTFFLSAFIKLSR